MAEGVHGFLLRLKALFLKRRMERDMAAELDFHQELLRERLLREGTPRAEVDAATRRAFGNARRWHERLRELWQFRTMETLARDVSFSVRMLRKSPGFTAVALLTLALGVGANTSVFSIINGLLLRPLPVPHSDQLAVLGFTEGGSEPEYAFPTPFFRSLETRHEIFEDVFAFNADTLQVRNGQGNESVPGMLVSGQFFRALQTAPIRGRYLTPQDDRAGSPNGLAVVISEHFWESWFNRAPDVVGRKLVIANAVFTVVGVMPKRFIGADPAQRPEIYAPLSTDPIIDAPQNHIDAGTHAWWLTVGARRQAGVTLEQANVALETISLPILREAAADDPDYLRGSENSHFRFEAEPGAGGFTYARMLFRKPLVAMFAMCCGILVLACLNLASLLMARGAARERELATRLAMGATRGRLLQQLMVESLLIAVLGTAVGLATVPVVNHALASVEISDHSGNDHVRLDTSLDLRVFGFAALAAVLSAVLIGLVPALQATSGNLNDHIKDEQHATQAHERRRILPKVMLSLEVGLALMLVVGAGLLATSLVRLYKSGIGFDPHGVVNFAFKMDKQPLEGDALMRVYQEMGDGLSHQPGVKSVSFQFIVPLSHRGWNAGVKGTDEKESLIWMNSVAPKYFETMRIPMYRGREFRWNDTKASGLKIVLNDTAAKLLFPNQGALGQRVVMTHEKTSYEVVAVVGDAKYRDMRTPAPPTGYVPIMQDEQAKPSLNAVVRMSGPAAPLAAAVRSLAARLAPSIPAPVMTTMDDVVSGSLLAERMLAMLSLFFAGCALFVTAIGLYGTLAYATARRTSEIGIRMALGARRGQVVGMIFRENAAVAIAGCVAGLIAALLASRALASFLYGVSEHDPWVLAGSVTSLAAIASAASLLPALRAARIEPMSAIRCE